MRNTDLTEFGERIQNSAFLRTKKKRRSKLALSVDARRRYCYSVSSDDGNVRDNCTNPGGH